MHTFILAGGTSSRMGQNKALLPFKNQVFITYLYEHFTEISDDITVISNTNDVTIKTGIVTIKDDSQFVSQGPLAGMYTAMKRTDADICFILACDMPYACPAVASYFSSIMKVQEIEAVIPIYEGKVQPLFACYRRSVLNKLSTFLLAGNRRVLDFLELLQAEYISKGGLPQELKGLWDMQFKNINTPKLYQSLQGGEL